MKKFTSLIVLLLSIIVTTNAQVATIGTGTSSPGNTLYAPVYRYSNTSSNDNARSNILFTAAELSAAGIPNGATITKISFNKTSTGGTTSGPGVLSIYMNNSSTTPPLSTSTTWSSIQSSHTQVYNNTAQNIPTSTGWFDFTLNTPFVYSGNSLEIAFDWDISGPSLTSDNFAWEYTPGFEDYIVGNASSSPPSTLSGTVSSYKERPNIQITFTSGPCTAPPTAGMATANNALVCSGANVQLGVTGTSFGTGQTYVWESAATAGGTYTAISSSSTSSSYAINPTTSMYYRVAVTCSGQTAYSTPVYVEITNGLSGVYTIDAGSPASSTSFQSFNDFKAALSCGVVGPVTVNVAANSGPYNEQLILTSITGASATNTITINGNGDTLTFASSTSSERAGITLDGADYVTVNDLVIVPTGTYGWGALMTNDADNNTINNCTLIIDDVSTSENYCGIIVSGSFTDAEADGSDCDNITISNNTIHGGHIGISVVGDDNVTYVTGNKILNNIIEDFYDVGIYVGGNDGILIEENDISRPNRTSFGISDGIELVDDVINSVVSKNRLHDLSAGNTGETSTIYALTIDNSDATAATPNVFSNNLLYNMVSSGTWYALYNTSSDYSYYYHNTVVLDDSSFSGTSSSYPMYNTSLTTGLDIKNNIFYNTRGGTGSNYGIYINTSGSTFTSDNNDVFVAGITAVNNYGQGPGGTDYVDLAAWQAGLSQGANSLEINPQFVDPSANNYEPTAALLDNKGTPVGITTDITNATRSGSTPDIGAIEFFVPVCAAPPTPGTIQASAVNVCSGDPVTITLNGNSQGATQTYTLESSPTLTGTYTAVGATQSTFTFNINPTVTAYYRVAVECTGQTAYTDTVLVTVPAFFASGTYTINSTQPTGGTNFISFADAVNAIQCGIAGPVQFDVITGTGPYNEQVYLRDIANTSSTNTITFNGNGETLTYNSTTSSDRAGFKLDGTDWVTIDNMVIEPTGTYGFGIQLINNADNNTINNCTILNDVTSSSSNYVGIALTGSETSATSQDSDCDSNTLTNNTIIGGYYGISMYGSSTSLLSGNTIANNSISDFYGYATILFGHTGLTVENNDVFRVNRSSFGTSAGIYLLTGTTNSTVAKNRIHDLGVPSETSTIYGIYLNSADATAGNENIISNNLIYNMVSDGTIYGIYNTGSDYSNIYHNTVVLDDAAYAGSSTTRGFYNSSTSATGMDIKNNIFYITRGGTGTTHGIYIDGSSSTFTADNNNVYLGATTTTNYYGQDPASTNYADLGAWQTGTSQGSNSLEVDPQFTNVAAGNFEPTTAVLDNQGIPVGVTVDINNLPRSGTTPDIGAIEFTVPVCTSPPTPGTATASSVFVCSGTAIDLDLQGNSIGIGQTYTWQASATSGGTYTDISSASNTSSFSTNPTVPLYYRAAVTCSGNTQYSTPVFVDINNGMAGNYTVDTGIAKSNTNFHSIQEAVDAMTCGGVTGSVVVNVAANTIIEEQINVPQLTGASAANTVTINGNGDTLRYNATSSSDRAGFKLDGADFITINNFVIQPEGTYGFGIHMLNDADFNTVTNCTILNDRQSSSANYSGIVISGSTSTATTSGSNCDGITIDNNTIIGGDYGITLTGTSTTIINNNTITNNVLEDTYDDGIYITYNNNLLVENNDISRPNRTSFNISAAIRLGTDNTNSAVSKNRIHDMGDPADASSIYGIELSGCDATIGNENIISNNLIYDFVSDGALYGMYNSSSDYALYYHNTIVLDDATYSGASITRAFYNTSATTGLDIKNNIFYVTRGGTGDKHGIYINTTGTTFTSDNNIFFINSGTPATDFIGQDDAGTDYATLNAWQTATSQDVNSATGDPVFQSPVTGNYTPTSASLDNIGIFVGITTDITGAARSNTTPDAGAYEFTGNPLAVKLLSFTAVRNGEDVNTAWATATETANDKFVVERSANGSEFTDAGTVDAAGNSNTMQSYEFTDAGATQYATAGKLYYRLRMVSVTGEVEYSNVAVVNVNGITTDVSVYPNPFNDYVQVNTVLNADAQVDMVIMDVTGKVVYKNSVKVEKGQHATRIDGLSHLPSGVYELSVNVDGQFYNYKLVK